MPWALAFCGAVAQIAGWPGCPSARFAPGASRDCDQKQSRGSGLEFFLFVLWLRLLFSHLKRVPCYALENSEGAVDVWDGRARCGCARGG